MAPAVVSTTRGLLVSLISVTVVTVVLISLISQPFFRALILTVDSAALHLVHLLAVCCLTKDAQSFKQHCTPASAARSGKSKGNKNASAGKLVDVVALRSKFGMKLSSSVKFASTSLREAIGKYRKFVDVDEAGFYARFESHSKALRGKLALCWDWPLMAFALALF